MDNVAGEKDALAARTVIGAPREEAHRRRRRDLIVGSSAEDGEQSAPPDPCRRFETRSRSRLRLLRPSTLGTSPPIQHVCPNHVTVFYRQFSATGLSSREMPTAGSYPRGDAPPPPNAAVREGVPSVVTRPERHRSSSHSWTAACDLCGLLAQGLLRLSLPRAQGVRPARRRTPAACTSGPKGSVAAQARRLLRSKCHYSSFDIARFGVATFAKPSVRETEPLATRTIATRAVSSQERKVSTCPHMQ